MSEIRVGFGTDIHRLVTGRPLIVGGVEIPFELGSRGYSDADVLLHAVTDAMLGALALGDIGSHFPETEERWRNAESSVFVVYVLNLLKHRGYHIVNVDSVVELERPKLREYIDTMRENLAAALEIDVNQVSVKAKSGEGIGEVGEGRAVRAQAVVLVARD